MNKYLLLLVFLSLITSCNKSKCCNDTITNNEPASITNQTKSAHVNISSDIVSREEADFIVGLLFSGKEIVSVEPVESTMGTAVRLYNFEDGWVAISGDKRMAPVIGSEETGFFIPKKCSNNGMLTWLEMVKEEFETLQSEELKGHKTEYSAFWNSFANTLYLDERYQDFFVETKDSDTMYYWRKEYQYSYNGITHDTIIKDHLIETHWGQEDPWNSDFPMMIGTSGVYETCPAGCVAVAMGQIMKYYHDNKNFNIGLHHNVSFTMPNDTTVIVSRQNYVSNSSRWAHMAKTYPESVTDYVRDFLLEIGGAIGMKYGPNGSKASDSPSQYALFGVNCVDSQYYSRDVYFNIIYPQLALNMPIHVSARRRVSPTKTKGHSWIIDGALYSTTTVFNVYRWVRYEMPSIPNLSPISDHIIIEPAPGDGSSNNHEFDHEQGEVVIEQRNIITHYLLMNWGYDGDGDDGHYSIETSEAWQIWDRYYTLNREIMYDFSQTNN